MRDFRDLDVWKKSHALALEAYTITRPFPKEELYGLVSQIRRCASSVPANIAEGCGADSDAEFARFLTIAMRSATELEYHLLLARDLDLLSSDVHSGMEQRVVEVKKMLTSFIRKMRPRKEWPTKEAEG
ncbi:MAG: four helix bundle protein [Chloroflexota bacterium]